MGRQIRRRFPYSISCLAGLCWLALAGCRDKALIEGVVLDNFSQPVAGVEVQIAGTTLAAETDARGRYAVPYYPGSVTVLYRKDGYQHASREFEVAGKAVIPAETVSLFKHPPKQQSVWFKGGVWLLGTTDYVPLQPADRITVLEELAGDGFDRVSTYQVDGEVTEIEINPAMRNGDTNTYWVDFVETLPDPFVVLRDEDLLFRFQPLYKLNEQEHGVRVLHHQGLPRRTVLVEPGSEYVLAALGEESCGFLTCQTLEQPAYRFRPKLPGE